MLGTTHSHDSGLTALSDSAAPAAAADVDDDGVMNAGRLLFAEALQQGTMTGFFKLIEQYRYRTEQYNNASSLHNDLMTTAATAC
jgi:hypothetical protein